MNKYNEALHELERVKNQLFGYFKNTEVYDYDIEDYEKFIIEPIRQALLTAQEQEKALKIIYEKNVDIELLKKETTTLESYNKWIEFLDSTSPNNSENENLQLIQEEFDLLKRYCRND